MAGDDDDLGDARGLELADFGKGVETVAIGQPDVEQDEVVAGVADELESFGGGAGGGDGVAFIGEDGGERFADFGFIVHDQNVVHGSLLPLKMTGSSRLVEPWARIQRNLSC